MVPDVEKEIIQKKATKKEFKPKIDIGKVVPEFPVANSDRKIEKKVREESRKMTTDHKTSVSAKKVTDFRKYSDKESESSSKKEEKTQSSSNFKQNMQIKEREEKLKKEAEDKLRREREEKERLLKEKEERLVREEKLKKEAEDKVRREREQKVRKEKPEAVHRSPAPVKRRKITVDEPASRTPNVNIKDKLGELDSKFELEKAKTAKKTTKPKIKKTMTINLKASSYPAKHRPMVIHLGICFEQIRIINVSA